MKPNDDVQCFGTRRHQVDRMASGIRRERYAVDGLLSIELKYEIYQLISRKTYLGFSPKFSPEEVFRAIIEEECDIVLFGLKVAVESINAL